MAASFSDWLKSRGIDEAALDGQRHAQLHNFWKHDTEEAKLHPEFVKDCDGADVKIGDTVTVTYRVTGTHHLPDDPARGTKGRTAVNLSKITKGGDEVHALTCESTEVKKS